jgi:anti-anti-sigma factor
MIMRLLRRIGRGLGRSSARDQETRPGLVIEPLESEPGFRLSGEVDILSGAALREALEPELHGTLVVDLTAVDWIDETGLATLLRAHKRLHDQGGSLILRSPRGQVLRVLEVTGVAELPGLTIEPDGGNP